MNKRLKYTCPVFKSSHTIEFKNCFGAIAGYVRGRIFISCGKFGIALKLPKEVLDELFKERGVKRLKYFPQGARKKGVCRASRTDTKKQTSVSKTYI